ncbi:jg7442 [Pararge aegeria aegeria]|uniref:Jg7442 protein n=4 Tax=Pararge aegeria TaxID=116150 RepID=A0A8S4S8E5_9NEOP|nr:jg7442 [Pararge aegeria aegeria]
MAGNKINTKKKDDKSKSSRNADQAVEENEDSIDFSLLRKPILTSITGFAQARKIFDLATEELKGLLSNECDLLYECKVCRNMFRSLANFISHKRIYCKQKFDSSVHGHFLKATSVMDEIMKIKKLEVSYQESLNDKIDLNNSDEDDDSRIPITKDLTSIVEKITKNEGVQHSDLESKQLVFQKIPKSSVAVFQNIKTGNNKTDTMKAQVDELNDILSQENAVLQSDGSFKVQSDVSFNVQSNDKVEEDVDNVIQISDDDENEESDILKCKLCDLQFSTLKTWKFHIKNKHLENRLVYPCPDCLDIFSTSWSVYRHLFKVHRKTAAQIRRLREAIQAKAFRMNNPPTFYEKRKSMPKPAPTQKITEEERLYKENQAWLEELDGESEGRRCGGCGRTFERRAALAAHTHTCARRDRRRIQIQIRKDYNKEPNNPYLAMAGCAAQAPTETKMSVEDVKKADNVQENKVKKDEIDEEPPEAESPVPDDIKQETEYMETDEPVIQNNKPIFYDNSMINKLPYAQQTEKNNLNAFRQKIQLDVDLFKLLCKKCDIKHDKIADFLDHMSSHYKWVRYACKLCNFKHFNFDKLPEHVKVVHKLKGNTEFYFSTVKAIDGTEALELSESIDEQNESNKTNSRRPSRCSSDSSRLSDDSSSSSTRPETGSRKRKSNLYKMNAKKKRQSLVTDAADQNKEEAILLEEGTAPNSKIFEENSSDFDEVEEKSLKRKNTKISSVASRRPVRKKTKPKNADFEYDLSNLLKMEAQGYRDSQTVIQGKKKTQQELQINYDIINKDCCGAMITLSRKSVENSQGHMKTASIPAFKASKESRVSRVFVRPMVPRITKMDKNSPKKVESEEVNNSGPSKVPESSSPILEPISDTCETSEDINEKPKKSIVAKIFNPNINKVLEGSVPSSGKDNKLTQNNKTFTQTSKEVVKESNEIVQTKSINTDSIDLNKDVNDGSISVSEKGKKLTLENENISTQTNKNIRIFKDINQSKTVEKKITDLDKNDKDKSVSCSEKGKIVSLETDKILTKTGKGIVQKPRDVIKTKTIDSILSDLNKDIKVTPLSISEKGNKNTLGTDETSTQTSICVVKKPKDSIQTKQLIPILQEVDVTDRSVLNSENDQKLCLELDETNTDSGTKTEKDTEKITDDTLSLSKPSNSSNTERNMVPFKFRRQGLEVIKNPLIKQNITDFTKAGMKTKILVIKPINRSADRINNLNAPLKFQTIKLKDPSKSNANNEEIKSDQVVVVQVPKVDCGISRSSPTPNINNGVSLTMNSAAILASEKFEKDVLSNQVLKKNCNDNDTHASSKAINVKILGRVSEKKKVSEDLEETPNSDERTLNHDKSIIVETLKNNLEENFNQKDEEQTTNQTKILNLDQSISVKSLEMNPEESLDQQDHGQTLDSHKNEDNLNKVDHLKSESTNITNESAKVVNEVLVDSNKIVSQES